MTPCPSCQTWARPGTCPTCGAVVKAPVAASAALVAFSMLATACYGVGPTGPYDTSFDSSYDGDSDGFTVAQGDCDDTNPAIHPDAVETVGDGIDSNCDTSDDT